MGAAASAVGMLTKASLDNYAEYEQLVGGVETLFKDSSDKVQQYAANAYKTAGMSANQYMETVTGFSASLLQSLGGDTEKAADVADRAITDMSDNANKMGTSMESIQYAYQGFAKQNYTMLDNLKLGYGGTKQEMERLLADAEKLSGQKFDLSSYADIVEAIHVVQENMGITGTTAKEAASTIQGSVASAKSAWQNLVTGIADENANLDDLINQFIDSAVVAGNNIIPRVQQILAGIGSAIQQFAPIISEQIPMIITTVLPDMLDAGTSLLTGLIGGIVAAAPTLVDAAVSALSTLTTYLIENLPLLVGAAGQIVSTLVTSIGTALPQLLSSGMQMLDQLAFGIESGLPNMISRLPQIITELINFLTNNLPQIVEKGSDVINALANGIINAIPDFVAALPSVVSAFVNYFTTMLPTFIEEGIEILLNLTNGIISALPKLTSQLPQVISKITSTLAAGFPKILQSGVELLMKFGDGIFSAAPKLLSKIPQIIRDILNSWGSAVSGAKEIGKNIIQGVWSGISQMASWIKNKLKSFFSGLVSSVKGFLGIHSPSKVFAGIGGYMAEGLGEGWDNAYSKIARDIGNDLDFSGNITTTGSYSGDTGKPVDSALLGTTINITVNGANIQDDQSLAERIAFEMQMMLDRRRAAFGRA